LTSQYVLANFPKKKNFDAIEKRYS